MPRTLDIDAAVPQTWSDAWGPLCIRAKPKWTAAGGRTVLTRKERAAVHAIGVKRGCAWCRTMKPYSRGRTAWPAARFPFVAKATMIERLKKGRPPPQVLVPACWRCNLKHGRASQRKAKPAVVTPPPIVQLERHRSADTWSELIQAARESRAVEIELMPAEEIKRVKRADGRPRTRPIIAFADYAGYDQSYIGHPRCRAPNCCRRLKKHQRIGCCPEHEELAVRRARTLLERLGIAADGAEGSAGDIDNESSSCPAHDIDSATTGGQRSGSHGPSAAPRSRPARGRR